VENNSLPEQHPFEPFVPPGAQYLLIGTFPGRQLTQKLSGERRDDDWYYGTHIHSLWDLLGQVYGRPQATTKLAKQELLAELKMGITDVIAAAHRKRPTNNDSDLLVAAFQTEKLAELLKSHKWQALYFTSKQAHKWFTDLSKELQERFAVPVQCLAVPMHVLPSPSPQYVRFKHGTIEGRRNFYRAVLPGLA